MLWNCQTYHGIAMLYNHTADKMSPDPNLLDYYDRYIKDYTIEKQLAFLQGDLYEEYCNAMKIAQQFASVNRNIIAYKITEYLKLKPVETFETIHNYINFDDKVVRKGAISAHQGEKVIIPLNMRDGSIIAIGKGATPHFYRHSHASHALDNGCPIHLVQKQLNHSSLSTVARYLHARPTESSSKYLK